MHPSDIIALAALTLFSFTQVIIGLGYRTLGWAIFKASLFGVLGSIICSIAAFLFYLPGSSGPYAEGAGLALFFLWIGAALLGFLGGFVIGLVWFVMRSPRGSLGREARSRSRVVWGTLGFLPLLLSLASTFYWQKPALHSDSQLVSQLLNSREREPSSQLELQARGTKALPELIARIDREVSQNADSVGYITLMETVANIGGAEAVEALRRYLRGNYAPAVRARAALLLGTTIKDQESVNDIAQLLALRQREWRYFQPALIEALQGLEAKEKIPAIIAALERDQEIAGTSIETILLSRGIATLVHFDTAESWAAIERYFAEPERRRFTMLELRRVDKPQAHKILLAALDGPHSELWAEACLALIEMPSLRPHLSYYSCPYASDESWQIVTNEIRLAVNITKQP